jgi:hypothetical protein
MFINDSALITIDERKQSREKKGTSDECRAKK